MNFIQQFPILNTCSYLNTAGSGILSKSLLDWRANHDMDFFNTGSAFRDNQAVFLQEVRVTVARFFNGKVENTFLVPNFSFGFNTFLAGLAPTHRFLLVEEDYPSVNYAVESRGFECDYASFNQNLEENIVEKIKTFKPTVFALSIVQYISGNKIGLDFIKKIKLLFPELLIVADGTQFCGTEEFNFEQSGLDVLISSGYKWMLAGYGNGFVLLKDEVADHLYAAAKKKPFPIEPFLKDKGLLSLYFEPGHQDTLAFGSLNHSILYLEQVGLISIENNIKELIKKAKSAFTERELLDPVVVERKEHSSIFNINISDDTFKSLLEHNIICISRGRGIRVSFHAYNTEQDLNRLLGVIDQ